MTIYLLSNLHSIFPIFLEQYHLVHHWLIQSMWHELKVQNDSFIYIYIVLNKTPIKPAIWRSINLDSTNMVNCLLGKTQVYGSACALFISLAA